MEKIAWLVLLAVIVATAPFAHRSTTALRIARTALGVWYLAAGALVNLVYLATGTSYATFADSAHLALVRSSWHSVVAPHQVLWIALLIAFEATAGALLLSGGRRAEVGMTAVLVMQAGLLVFGWLYTILGGILLVCVALLLRAQRHADGPDRAPATSAHGLQTVRDRP